MMADPAQTIIADIFAREGIVGDVPIPLVQAYSGITRSIMARATGDTPLVVGVCGAQGSGKSTLALVVQRLLTQADFPTAQFSLDDLYKTLADREVMAATIHPLFRTRGVPGTHDVSLGLSTLQALSEAAPDSTTAIPAFDKARDDRRAPAQWPRFYGKPRVILFEGWCVGARAQDEAALRQPINALERDDDADGTWRHAVNRHLAGEYQALFGRLGMLILLCAPGFETVYAWRKQQEDRLRSRLDAQGQYADQTGVMNDAQLARFIQHYERITRHILSEMPDRADICVLLQPDRSIGVMAVR